MRKLRVAGGIVNRSITIAGAQGIVNFHDPSLLVQNGGVLELSRKLAEAIMKLMGLVRRKGTQVARKVPLDFDVIRQNFVFSHNAQDP